MCVCVFVMFSITYALLCSHLLIALAAAPEVDYLDRGPAGRPEEDILRLQVAVDDVDGGAGEELEGAEDLLRELEGGRETSGARRRKEEAVHDVRTMLATEFVKGARIERRDERSDELVLQYLRT